MKLGYIKGTEKYQKGNPNNIINTEYYTIVKGSNLEFNIRWYGWGITACLIGILIGYIIWGVK